MTSVGWNRQYLVVTKCVVGVACTVCAMAEGAGTVTPIAGTMTKIAAI
jgi:hypothetical protein